MVMSLVFAVSSCGDDDTPDVKFSDKGTVTDNLGNTYEWVRIGNLRWTTTNARNGMPMTELTSYVGWGWYPVFRPNEVEELEQNYLPVFGNLMNWEEACESAPEGWRLPTDEDWMALESAYGLDNPRSTGFRGSGVGYSLQNGDTGLGLLCGGGLIGKQNGVMYMFTHEYRDEFGYYWTSTGAKTDKDSYEAAYGRKIAFSNGGICRKRFKTDKCFSVRWVQDVK